MGYLGIAANEEFIHVYTAWVLDKRHYDAVVVEMTKECENISIKKKTIFHSSFDEIDEIIRQKLIDVYGKD